MLKLNNNNLEGEQKAVRRSCSGVKPLVFLSRLPSVYDFVRGMGCSANRDGKTAVHGISLRWTVAVKGWFS